MKLNKYFLIGAMGLGLFACSDNDLADNGQNGSQAEKTVLSTLTLDFSKMSARTVSDPATTEQNGTRVDASEAESKISNIYIVLSDNGTTISQVEGGEISADETSSTQTLGGTATYDVANKKISFTTTQGEKKVYVVLNADEVPAENGNIDTYFNTLADLSQLGTNGFMMSNANGAVSAAFWNGQTTELTIPVDRVVAKVTVTATALVATDKSIKDESGNDKDVIANVSDLSFKFKNDRTSGFRMNAAKNSTAPTTGGRNAANGAENVAITTGVQPSSVAPIYCLEDIEGTRDEIADAANGEWNVTYLTFSLVYNPAKLLDENLEYQDNEVEANKGKTHYYIATGEYTGMYILEDTYNNLGKDDQAKLGDALLKYTNGVHHFGPIWVGGTQGAADEGTILRNYWYNYDLATVLLPGKTDEPGTGEKDGDPKAIITVSLLDWIWLNNDINL